MNTLQQLKDDLTYEYKVTKKLFDKYPEIRNNYYDGNKE